MLKKFIRKYQCELFATVGMGIVLWQLLLPGYILLLDWPAGPVTKFNFSNITSFINIPSNLFLLGLNYFLPGWIIQKILMAAIFWLAFYLPLKFYPFDKHWQTNKEKYSTENTSNQTKGILKIEYFVATFYALNPFIYERFISGQWRVIAGYLSVFPLVSSIIKFHQQSSWKQARNIFLILLLTGFFSVHFLVIDGLIIFFYLVCRLITSLMIWLKQQIIIDNKIKQKNPFHWFKKIFSWAIIFLVVSGYWLIPYTQQNGSVVDKFDSRHQRAFATAIDKKSDSVIYNVIQMHGFWGEDHKWVEQFSLPKENSQFSFIFNIIIFFIFFGLMSLIRSKKYRFIGIWLFLLGISSLIFSSGPYRNIFQDINQWLFNNISFWRGFRDTEKWSGVLVTVYVLLAGFGLQTFSKQLSIQITKKSFSRNQLQELIIGLASLMLLFLTPQMLFGFNRQIQKTWYPPEWAKVNTHLQKQNNCRALFLPWHQYYSLQFNYGKLTSNISPAYFNCKIIAGHNTELWGIQSIATEIPNYQEIEKTVTSNNPEASFTDKVIKTLKEHQINYIIWTNDLEKADLYKYPFLKSNQLQKIIHTDKITLYKL